MKKESSDGCSREQGAAGDRSDRKLVWRGLGQEDGLGRAADACAGDTCPRSEEAAGTRKLQRRELPGGNRSGQRADDRARGQSGLRGAVLMRVALIVALLLA